MYALIRNGVVEKYPYFAENLRQDNPNTSFPQNISDTLLAEWNVIPVQVAPEPAIDIKAQRIEMGPVEYVNNKWVQGWVVLDLTDEEKNAHIISTAHSKKSLRAVAYKEEADPLFFKAERGEISKEEWLAKVEEIRQRYPD